MAGNRIRANGQDYYTHADLHLPTGPDPVLGDDVDYKTELDYDGAGNLIYLGRSTPSTATSAGAWQVKRFSYIGANLTAVEYANGTTAFTAVWDNRASLSYS